MTNLLPNHILTPNKTAEKLLGTLHSFSDRFSQATARYSGSIKPAEELEELVAEYSEFVTDPTQDEIFLELASATGMEQLVDQLRAQSALGVAIMEKYRALRLLEGEPNSAAYFANIESCIAEEFGAMAPDGNSKILLVGSGSFPMTLLHIAKVSGASTLGIDIDNEALQLGRQVVQRLGGGLDIQLDSCPLEELEFSNNATHIVFSSTVRVKYELLHQLHRNTREDVVVAMRFGNGLKSLFNYPMEPVDSTLWRLTQIIHQPKQVFDIALYVKQGTTSSGRITNE